LIKMSPPIPGPAPRALLEEPASLARRGVAKTLDSLILGAFGLVGEAMRISAVFYLLLPLILAYWIQSEYSATPGKWLCGIKIRSTNPQPISFGRALFRVLGEVFLLPIFMVFLTLLLKVLVILPSSAEVLAAAMASGVIYLRPFLHPRRHAWHDTLASTEVVQTESARVGYAALSAVASIFVAMVFLPKELRGLETRGRSAVMPLYEFKPIIAGTDDPCLRMRFCLIAYVTPWCPACETMKPTLKRMKSLLSSSSVGVQIIMGQDRGEKIQEACQYYGPDCIDDQDGSLAKKFRVHRFPSLEVWDKQTSRRVSKPQSFVIRESASDEQAKLAALEKLEIPKIEKGQ